MPRRRNPQTIANQIHAYLVAHHSPLAPYTSALMQSAQRWGVDPTLLLGISGAETSYATDPNAGRDITTGHNPFGMGPHIQYGSWPEAFDAAARNLRQNYLNKGLRSVEQIAPKWVGYESSWPQTVNSIMSNLGGNGGDVGPGRVPFRSRSWLSRRYEWLPRVRA